MNVTLTNDERENLDTMAALARRGVFDGVTTLDRTVEEVVELCRLWSQERGLSCVIDDEVYVMDDDFPSPGLVDVTGFDGDTDWTFRIVASKWRP